MKPNRTINPQDQRTDKTSNGTSIGKESLGAGTPSMFFTARAFTTEGVFIAIRRVGAATPMGTRSGRQERSECRCRRVVAAAAGCAAMVAETICDSGLWLVVMGWDGMGWEWDGGREGGRRRAGVGGAGVPERGAQRQSRVGLVGQHGVQTRVLHDFVFFLKKNETTILTPLYS
jgi:hypothetical protein